jgi:queuine tRNA-ribosyltransferase
MGVGTPFDLLRGMGAGIDLFDCVLPTRNARNGQALTWSGRVNLKQARHATDERPLDPKCDCPACTRFTRAYLHHLIRAEEMLGARLVTQHNLHFYGALTRAGRQAIEEKRYAAFADDTARAMREGDEVGPADPRSSAWKPPGERKPKGPPPKKEKAEKKERSPRTTTEPSAAEAETPTERAPDEA